MQTFGLAMVLLLPKPELAERIMSHLDRNEVATSFRVINKAMAKHLIGPEHTTVRLSQPVPPHAFTEHWVSPGATRRLTLQKRRKLLSLTAATGVVANLEVAEQVAGCLLCYEVFEAAASAGQLVSCKWLLERGCPTSPPWRKGSGLLAAAAGGGHWRVCEWLLSLDLTWSSGGEAEAARGGHVRLMEHLQERCIWPEFLQAEYRKAEIVKGVSHGCDLATLQRLWPTWGKLEWQDRRDALAAAAGSSTPDWASKVEWLEEQGCPRSAAVACGVVSRPDAFARLAWLRGRGYPLDESAVEEAARAGNMELVRHLVTEASVPPADDSSVPTDAAALAGHLTVLQALHGAGWALFPDAAAEAATSGGHVHVLAWLLETFGAAALELDDPGMPCAAGNSCSAELLTWLREHGCDWCEATYRGAAESGCEVTLEWLAERGCPMPDDGSPYTAACVNGDLATARCLRRLGCPWGSEENGPFSGALHAGAPVPMIRWLLEEGCPVDCETGPGGYILGGYMRPWPAGMHELVEEFKLRRRSRRVRWGA
ncbi:hypothetical protein GPECTOR_13g754 [Gonium pectorale]|uniref:Uncharacterized protein n=1 Tax=Gonium pectorale TaxID=33097 RepID=A0A150GN75_GONPE|nr:hypothetical protein GPECTOR_13g754 [Gonium pectorale]|eukprot:KXZ51267.1 hypothetical protein GPECTOR_13g754 [Gonium pectorale]